MAAGSTSTLAVHQLFGDLKATMAGVMGVTTAAS